MKLNIPKFDTDGYMDKKERLNSDNYEKAMIEINKALKNISKEDHLKLAVGENIEISITNELYSYIDKKITREKVDKMFKKLNYTIILAVNTSTSYKMTISPILNNFRPIKSRLSDW